MRARHSKPGIAGSDQAAAPLPLGWIVLVWRAPATIAVLQSTVQYAMIGVLDREWISAALQFPRWLAWAAVTPGIVRLTRWGARRSKSVGQSVLAHIAAALGAIVVVEVTWTLLAIAVEPAPAGPERPLPAVATYLTAWRTVISPLGRLAIGAITYVSVVAVVLALDAHASTRQAAVRTAYLERDLADARVQAIKMQVHPHFLFNTLHAVAVLITENPEQARTMVVRLGDLLRASLARAGQAEVTLEQELALLSRYLDIEQVRFGDRLIVESAIEPAVLAALVPDLVLQPLAENAIKHGLSRHPGRHRIRISGQRLGSRVVLTVDDDRVGAAYGVARGAPRASRDAYGESGRMRRTGSTGARQPPRGLQTDTAPSGTRAGGGEPGLQGTASGAWDQEPVVLPTNGVGLETVRRRLSHLYGAAQSFELYRRDSGGMRAMLVVPYHTAGIGADAAADGTSAHDD